MKPTSTLVQMDQKEEETLSFEVSDEALESAAVTEMAALTLALCTGLNGLPVLVTSTAVQDLGDEDRGAGQVEPRHSALPSNQHAAATLDAIKV